MKKIIYLLALSLLVLAGVATPLVASPIKNGADRLDHLLPLLEGKRVGLIINHTSVVGAEQTCLLDTLLNLGVEVVKVFAPEHGFRGDADAGETVADGHDLQTGVPIVSLYGSNKRPSREQLAALDVVVFDIQDVGARFYTYISTLYYAMQSCAKYGVGVVVLDRPNPNDYVDGCMLKEEHKSFVGALPLPILHGLTVGELAQMIRGEGWCPEGELRLSVVPIEGWRHGDPYILPIKPSPNLPTAQSVALYPSLCLFEATKVSVGRGTYTPFEVIGYPDPKFGEYTFVPESLEGFDKNPLQKGNVCYGVDLREVEAPQGLSLGYLIEFMKISGQGEKFISSCQLFDLLAGDERLREMLVGGATEEQIRAEWQADLERYKIMRRKYLLYADYGEVKP